ncbi:hypothetical protein C8P68_102332 [Mucilaginibacter yixingensis]|uniref:Glycerophosphoryl diester phosphodiesterase family protein n=1 Tax=Mucilaginibacter yixingensis TaxID=1295612 RepID=A0A2T5JCL4_9SPHI|nr:hypothetical protein [Mucilaginibacter yixingensis]PTQ99508.1 hypothetical protein C8P68_102332 [Mucilaginibacter yixingensis]
MKEKVDLNRQREFGDIISDTFLILKQNFKHLFKYCLIISGLFVAAGVGVSILGITQRTAWDTGLSKLNGYYFAALVIQLAGATGIVITVVAYLDIYNRNGRQIPTLEEVWGFFRYYFFRVFATHIIATIVIVIAFLCCIVPGIYLYPVVALILPIMIIENIGPGDAVKKAFKLAKGNWWMIFGTLLLMAFIVIAAIAVLVIPAAIIWGGTSWLSGHKVGSPYEITKVVLTGISQFLWMVPIISVVLIYYSLSETVEAGGLSQRIKMFGQKPEGESGPHPEQY